MKHTILVIEDDPLLRQSMRDLLESEGFAVVEVADGQSAIDRLSQGQQASVILLDLNLPSVDGWQILEWLEGREGAPPVIVMSSIEVARVIETATAHQTAFLTKPLDADSLLALLECLIPERAAPALEASTDAPSA